MAVTVQATWIWETANNLSWCQVITYTGRKRNLKPHQLTQGAVASISMFKEQFEFCLMQFLRVSNTCTETVDMYKIYAVREKGAEGQLANSAIPKVVKYTLMSTSADKHTYCTQCVYTGREWLTCVCVLEMFVTLRGMWATIKNLKGELFLKHFYLTFKHQTKATTNRGRPVKQEKATDGEKREIIKKREKLKRREESKMTDRKKTMPTQ